MNEFDIMSFTVATTFTFSAAYVPGPMKKLGLTICVTSLTWVFARMFFLSVFHRVEWGNTIHSQSVKLLGKLTFHDHHLVQSLDHRYLGQLQQVCLACGNQFFAQHAIGLSTWSFRIFDFDFNVKLLIYILKKLLKQDKIHKS